MFFYFHFFIFITYWIKFIYSNYLVIQMNLKNYLQPTIDNYVIFPMVISLDLILPQIDSSKYVKY